MASVVALTAGTKLGPYEVVAPLGAGGMGEVYRARDTRLERTVAVKILPSNLSDNAEAKERFDREARAISSLSHPNICHLYDVGAQDGTSYLVMEYLEGETLADRLRRGPLPLEQFLKVAIETCEGLEKAHRNGVIHRDLKPANIMLTKSGAKLMDFGLAKALQPAAKVASTLTMTVSTPASHPLTAQGTVMGTFQYMSPEQVEGREADVRSDIFSLGAVLYEMLTGKRAFEGKTMASVMAAVLERDPAPVSSLQPMLPQALDRVVKTCLAKDPDERFQTVHDLKLQLRWIAEAGISFASTIALAPVLPRRASKEKLSWMVVGALALCLIALATWMLRRPQVVEPAPVLAFVPPPPDTHYLAFGFGAGPVAVSPDGTRLAFSAIDKSGVIKLWIRPLKAHDAVALEGTENASWPFWSPDSRTLGFFADGKLKTLDVANGSVQVLSEVSPQDGAAAWGPDGTILITSGATAQSRGYGVTPLYRVSALGGKPAPIGALSSDETAQGFPEFLPDGKHFLYASHDRSFRAHIKMGSLSSGERELVLDDANHPRYAAGFLLFVRRGELFAQRFDASSGTLSGSAVSLEDCSSYSLGGDSVLAFQATSLQTRLEWYDVEGKPLGAIGPVAEYEDPKISPDGKQILSVIAPQDYRRGSAAVGADLWSLPVTGGVSTRLTFGPGWKAWSVWSPDGRYIAHSAESEGKVTIARKPADGSGTEETLLTLDPDFSVASVEDWSPDGRYISYYAFSTKDGRGETWVLPMLGERKPFQPAAATADQYDGQFSPDGHWMAYFSYESGRPEVYVVPFPGPGGKYQISHTGGWNIRWAGKSQLFFLTTGNQLMEADLSLTPQSLQIKAMRPLFQMNLLDESVPLFDVTADGRRVLAVTPARAESNSIGLMLNWPSLAAKKMRHNPQPVWGAPPGKNPVAPT
jgi:eukaryotic-like serine/threonine-protein kinase